MSKKSEQKNQISYTGPKATFSYVIVDVSPAIRNRDKFIKKEDQLLFVPNPEPEAMEASIPATGIVVSIGPDCKVIKVGDRIVYPNGKAANINWEEKPSDKKYITALEGNIAGVF